MLPDPTGMAHQVPEIIVQQLGNRTLQMLGARDLMGTEKSLTLKVGRNAKSVSHLRITLEPSDTYKVEAIRVRKLTVKVLETREDVYCDSLHQVIETLTGMYTRL